MILLVATLVNSMSGFDISASVAKYRVCRLIPYALQKSWSANFKGTSDLTGQVDLSEPTSIRAF
jgi:hypothetical protein